MKAISDKHISEMITMSYKMDRWTAALYIAEYFLIQLAEGSKLSKNLVKWKDIEGTDCYVIALYRFPIVLFPYLLSGNENGMLNFEK